MYCVKIEFKDKTKNPIFGIITKEDSNYVYFKTRYKNYRISHNAIDVIENTDIPFEENGGDTDGKDQPQ